MVRKPRKTRARHASPSIISRLRSQISHSKAEQRELQRRLQAVKRELDKARKNALRKKAA